MVGPVSYSVSVPNAGIAPHGTASVAEAAPTKPELGRAAVTAIASTRQTGGDPWPAPPRDPAPLKGLGIPPLNTRHVGDFDRLDDPVMPVARFETQPQASSPAQLDQRR